MTGDYAANKNAKLLDFVAKNVVVTGEVTEKDGVKIDQRQVDQGRQLTFNFQLSTKLSTFNLTFN